MKKKFIDFIKEAEEFNNDQQIEFNLNIKKINSELNSFLRNKKFESVPLEEIFEIINNNNIIALQKDKSEWSGILSGKQGKIDLQLGDNNSYVVINKIKIYSPIKNKLSISWNFVNSEKDEYQIIAYVH